MTWEAAGVIAEIVGAAAVVVSLVYLALQIRTQNREARLAAMHDISVGYRDAVSTFANHELADLIVRANEDYDSLPDADKFQLMAANQRIMRVWEESYFQRISGNLDDYIWEPMLAQYASYMSMPSVQQFWRLRKEFFNKNFRQFVDDREATYYRLK